ncbi:MAG: thioesterase [Rhodobacterales bacterium]|nr:MAG: thioesterase [Rhodobacterales bacterium]
MPLKMTIPELEQFLKAQFPQVAEDFRILSLAENAAEVEMVISEQNLRPGGTVSGPSMFALADLAFYIALLAMIGPKALAVTTNASIDFMRKPAAGQGLVGTARILKLGRVLAVGDVLICAKGQDQPVARASMTYAIPPK